MKIFKKVKKENGQKKIYIFGIKILSYRVQKNESSQKHIFPQSTFAHHYLDGLKGIEIGGSAHNLLG